MERNPRKYEIAYIISSSIAEEAVVEHSQKIAALIEAEKGTISHSEIPQKRRLAYPIGKEGNGYFGWIKFAALPDAVEALEKKLKTMTLLLRHLVVEDTIPVQQFGRMPRPSAPPPVAAVPPKREEEADERLDLEALDKKLEEILGK